MIIVAVATVMVAPIALSGCRRRHQETRVSKGERLYTNLVVYERSERLERLCGEQPYTGVKYLISSFFRMVWFFFKLKLVD